MKFVRSLFAAAALLVSPFAFATSMTDYLENKLADHLFRTTTYSQPAVLAIGLLTGACSDSSAGTEVTNAGNYARVSLNPSNTNWKGTHASTTGVSSGTGGTVSNATAVTFGAPSGNWGTVTHFAVYDSATHGAGNMLFCAALTTQKTINNGDAAPSFAIDALTIQIDN